MSKKECFVCAACSYNCPNFQVDIANALYGYGIASDMGLEVISCKFCPYNSGHCNDCLFDGSIDCPRSDAGSDLRQ